MTKLRKLRFGYRNYCTRNFCKYLIYIYIIIIELISYKVMLKNEWGSQLVLNIIVVLGAPAERLFLKLPMHFAKKT